MNIMSRSLPVIVRIEWADPSTITARYLLRQASGQAVQVLHAPTVTQVGVSHHADGEES